MKKFHSVYLDKLEERDKRQQLKQRKKNEKCKSRSSK